MKNQSALNPLVIKGKKIRVPIIQGGMGIGVSLHPLAKAVAKEGGLGIISSAGLDRLISKRTGKKVNTYDATIEEISLSKIKNGFTGINIMIALARDYKASIQGALDAGADAIILGAGMSHNLQDIKKTADTALIPIVSSARTLKIICKKWEKWKYRPDAVILEGPLAGGHLGFKFDEIDIDENRVENLLPPVKDVAMKNGDFPVIVAGGVYTHDDILRFVKMGANGVQLGTRFLATEESSATKAYKQAVIAASKDDIVVAHQPGSPCGFPFRVIKQSPMYRSSIDRRRKPKCDKGYVLQKNRQGIYADCPAKEGNRDHFCICNGLLSSGNYNPENEEPLYTVGSNAYRIKKIISVKALIEDLTKIST
jgi:nitronate monooxygenase